VPENHLNFVYQLEGDVREVDVFKLAPTLLALGQLIQDSNRELYPDGREIGVNVKPFREGSFIVDLSLFPDSNLKQLLDLFTPHSLEQLKTLLEVIGLIGGGATATVVGAVKAMKFLRGRPKSVEEVQPGEFRLSTIDDRSITVGRSTNTLLQNSSITNNIFKIYVEPLEAQPSIEDVKTYLKDHENTAVKFERSEIPNLREFVNPSPTPTDPKETVKETIQHGIYLNPKRGAFGDDPQGWSFWRGHDEIITATIKDKEFLSKYAKGEVRLNQSDLLTVDLLERQKVKGTLVQKPIYEILKVTGYVKGATQDSLPADPEPASDKPIRSISFKD
jgi:hypothetical protein